MLAGVGLDLRPVDRHLPQLDQPGPPAQPQPLLEQPRQRGPVPLAKLAHRPEVGLVPRRQEAERHAVRKLPGDLARGVDPGAIPVEQHLDHHLRMVGWVAPILRVRLLNRRQVQRVHHVADKPGQVILGHPVRQRRRHQQQLIRVVGAKGLGHGRIIYGPHVA